MWPARENGMATTKCRVCLATLRESRRVDIVVSELSRKNSQSISLNKHSRSIQSRLLLFALFWKCKEEDIQVSQDLHSSPRDEIIFFAIDKLKLYSRTHYFPMRFFELNSSRKYNIYLFLTTRLRQFIKFNPRMWYISRLCVRWN